MKSVQEPRSRARLYMPIPAFSPLSSTARNDDSVSIYLFICLF